MSSSRMAHCLARAIRNETGCPIAWTSFWSKEFWPPNSPDLNTLDYYVRSVAQRFANTTRHPNVISLRSAIKAAFTNTDSALSKRALRAKGGGAHCGWRRIYGELSRCASICAWKSFIFYLYLLLTNLFERENLLRPDLKHPVAAKLTGCGKPFLPPSPTFSIHLCMCSRNCSLNSSPNYFLNYKYLLNTFW